MSEDELEVCVLVARVRVRVVVVDGGSNVRPPIVVREFNDILGDNVVES